MEKKLKRYIDRQIDRKIDREIEREIDRQTDRQTERHERVKSVRETDRLIKKKQSCYVSCLR